MPFVRPEGTEWWVVGQDGKTVGKFWPTREEAFNTALKHNQMHGVNAVYVMEIGGKNGRWLKETIKRSENGRGLS